MCSVHVCCWYLWRPQVPIGCLQSLSTPSPETGSLIEPGTQPYAWAAWLSSSLILSCPLPCSRAHTHLHTPCAGTVVTDTHHHTCVLCESWGFSPRPSCLCSRPAYQLSHSLALTVYFFLFNVNTNYFVKKTGSEQCIFKQ